MADMVKKVKVFLIKLYGKEGKMETRKKGSHLNIEERRQIAILDKEGWSPERTCTVSLFTGSVYRIRRQSEGSSFERRRDKGGRTIVCRGCL